MTRWRRRVLSGLPLSNCLFGLFSATVAAQQKKRRRHLIITNLALPVHSPMMVAAVESLCTTARHSLNSSRMHIIAFQEHGMAGRARMPARPRVLGESKNRRGASSLRRRATLGRFMRMANTEDMIPKNISARRNRQKCRLAILMTARLEVITRGIELPLPRTARDVIESSPR
jgi:hypothetical protein